MPHIRSLSLAAVLLLVPHYAFAQLVTLDPTNLVQNIMKVKQGVDEIKKLESQIKNTQAQLENMSGSRGMRRLVTDQTRAVIPRNWRESLDSLGAEGKQIRGAVDSIRRDLGSIGNVNLQSAPGKISNRMEQSARYDLEAWGRAQQLYNTSNQRFAKLDTLGDALDGATDLKDVMDLMARLQIETNMLLNEQLRMQAEMMATDRERTLQQDQRMMNDHARAMNSF